MFGNLDGENFSSVRLLRYPPDSKAPSARPKSFFDVAGLNECNKIIGKSTALWRDRLFNTVDASAGTKAKAMAVARNEIYQSCQCDHIDRGLQQGTVQKS